jgi:hypothetical protein
VEQVAAIEVSDEVRQARRARRPGANSARARATTPIKHTLQLGVSHPTDEKRDGRNVNRYAGNINANQ